MNDDDQDLEQFDRLYETREHRRGELDTLHALAEAAATQTPTAVVSRLAVGARVARSTFRRSPYDAGCAVALVRAGQAFLDAVVRPADRLGFLDWVRFAVLDTELEAAL